MGKLNASTLKTFLKTVSIIRCLWRREYEIKRVKQIRRIINILCQIKRDFA